MGYFEILQNTRQTKILYVLYRQITTYQCHKAYFICLLYIFHIFQQQYILVFPFIILDICMLRMTRARRSQVEQQHLINVEKAMEILSAQTPPLTVDQDKLNVCFRGNLLLNWHSSFSIIYFWVSLYSVHLSAECLAFSC